MAFDANDLSPHEHFVLERVRAGDVADFTQASPGEKAPVRAGFLRKLLLGLDPGWAVPAPGVRIRGARIEGALDLADCAGQGLPALMLERCDIPETVNVSHARIARLSFELSRMSRLLGVEVEIGGELNLCATAPAKDVFVVKLRGARIDGDVLARAARLARAPDSDEDALMLQGAEIEGSVLLDNGFEANGCVWLLAARVAGGLSCEGATFLNRSENGEGQALYADAAQFGSVILRKAKVEGQARFCSTRIATDFDMSDGASFRNEFGAAMMLANAEIGGQVFADTAKVAGQLWLNSCAVARNLDLRGAEITHRITPRGDTYGRALDATSASVGGAMLMQGANIKGEVLLADARIDGYLGFGGGRFINPGGWAIRAPNARVGGNLTFKIESDDATPHGPKTVIEGGLKLDRARIEGALSWFNLELRGPGPIPGKGGYFTFVDAQIAGPLQARALATQSDAVIAASGAACAALDDDVTTGWGAETALLELDGFSYGRIDSHNERWRARLAWLKRSRRGVERFSPQPYAQTASVYARAGRQEDARRIQLACRDLQTRAGGAGPLTRTLSSLFGLVAGYGLAPIRIVRALALFLVIGVVGVFIANEQGALVTPAGAQCNATIEPTLYAVDVALPVIDLGQETRCAPGRTARADLPSGGALADSEWRAFEGVALWRWAHGLYALLGSVLTALAVLTFSGVMKPRDE
jgi:hypothetical protein